MPPTTGALAQQYPTREREGGEIWRAVTQVMVAMVRVRCRHSTNRTVRVGLPIVYVDRVFICEAYLGTGVGSRSKCTFHAQGSTTKGSPEIDTDPRFTHLNGLEGQCRPPWKVSHLAPHEFSSLQWRRKCRCGLGADFRRRIRHCHCEQLRLTEGKIPETFPRRSDDRSQGS